MSVAVFIDRQELIGYTDLRLTRSKNETTGELSISIFMGWFPSEPVMGEVVRGQEVLVYFGRQLAFSGIIDRRRDTGDRSGEPGTQRGQQGNVSDPSIGPNQYTVRLTCRGKTKFLVDSSHQHTTATILNTTNREVFEELIKPWDIPLQWEAAVTKLERVRLRDGAMVTDELQRVAEMTGLYFYETRDGSLKVVDGPETEQGEALVLGTNILSFSTDQAGDKERSEVKVKGQKNKPTDWGEAAVLPTFKNAADTSVPNYSPINVQLYGDATDELLTKRIDYEVNKRSSDSKKISLEVFNVLQTDGTHWDIGKVHYVEIPPAGVVGNFEVEQITYTVDNDKTLKTSLTLSPLPIKTAAPAAQGGALGALEALGGGMPTGAGRAASLGVGALAQSWSGPTLGAVLSRVVDFLGGEGLDSVEDAAKTSPPLTLPRDINR
jgi:prophage tail gpP-like protein